MNNLKIINYSIKKISLGLCIGLLAGIFLAQHDPWVHEKCGAMFVKALSKALQCRVQATVHSIDFFKPEMVLENVTVAPLSGDTRWSWHAKRYAVQCSWWHFFTYGVIDMAVAMHGFNVRTTHENGALAIEPHMRILMQTPDFEVPLFLKSLALHDASLTIESPTGVAKMRWNSESKKINNRFKSHLSIIDGSIADRNRAYVDHLSGIMMLEAYDTAHGPSAIMNADVTGDLVGLANPACSMSISWDGAVADITGHAHDRAFAIEKLKLTKKGAAWDVDSEMTLPLLYAAYLLNKNSLAVNGSCSVTMQGTFGDQLDVRGMATSNNFASAWTNQPVAIISSYQARNGTWSGAADIALASATAFHGVWQWHEREQKGACTLSNSDAITNFVPGSTAPSWKINAHDIEIIVNATPEKISSSYACTAVNEQRQKNVCVSGSASANVATGEITITGESGAHQYHLAANAYNAPYIKDAAYLAGTQPWLTMGQQDHKIEAIIHVPLVRTLLKQMLQYDLQGEGALHLTASCAGPMLTLDAHLADGTIRLPQTYNFMNGCDARVTYDSSKRICTIENLVCLLHSGSMTCLRGVVWFAPDWSVSYAHVPLVFDRCLINSKKDLFATISGRLLLTKRATDPFHVAGNVMFNRSQVKENIFSEAFQKTVMQVASSLPHKNSCSVTCDLRVETKDPVRVDTDFLKANAQVRLAITGLVIEPTIAGSITVLSGTLKFPYKPLHITRGEIQFIPNQPLNPLVEMLAKNNIKNHNVALQITGSLRDHFVMLESTPPLTQEQIVGLLLAGAHDESLSVVIPALLMQNVTNLMFSSHQKGVAGLVDRYIRPWMKQVHVNLVPRLSDVGGRGGLRGALEISVNDRWRAMIEKNFSLTEDTRFELEYTLSDDVRFRVIRDERCDVGGEVEMTWKF